MTLIATTLSKKVIPTGFVNEGSEIREDGWCVVSNRFSLEGLFVKSVKVSRLVRSIQKRD
jgi:hypothetical protein